MFLRQSALALIVVTALAACGQQDTTQSNNASETSSSSANATSNQITITSLAGNISIPNNLTRIAALDTNTLSTLNELGEASKVVALPKGTPLPSILKVYSDNAALPDVGTLTEPNLEKVAAAKPELILINNRMEKLQDPLKAIAPVYYLQVDFKNYQQSFKEQTLNIAKMVGKTAEAEKQLAEIDKQVADIKQKSKGKTALIVMVNNEKISAFGPASRFGHVYDMYGFAPTDDSIKVAQHGMAISPEFIAEKNPDFLFVVDRGAAISEKQDGAKQVMNNDFVNKTKAAKNGKVIYLNSANWYLVNMGLGGMKAMTAEIADSLK